MVHVNRVWFTLLKYFPSCNTGHSSSRAEVASQVSGWVTLNQGTPSAAKIQRGRKQSSQGKIGIPLGWIGWNVVHIYINLIFIYIIIFLQYKETSMICHCNVFFLYWKVLVATFIQDVSLKHPKSYPIHLRLLGYGLRWFWFAVKHWLFLMINGFNLSLSTASVYQLPKAVGFYCTNLLAYQKCHSHGAENIFEKV